MQAATVLSLILGGLGAASGTTALLMQWRERHRKLLVVSTWVTAGCVENKTDYLLLLEVVNPTLEPVKVKAAGVFWAANQEMLFPLRPESGRRYKQPDHYTYDDEGLQYEATIPGRGSQETYGYVSDLSKHIVSGWETMVALRDRTDEPVLELATIIRAMPYPWERPRMVQLWPFCVDPLGKKFWGHPLFLDIDEMDVFEGRRQRLKPWEWTPKSYGGEPCPPVTQGWGGWRARPRVGRSGVE
jgi:hypothetical protein